MFDRISATWRWRWVRSHLRFGCSPSLTGRRLCRIALRPLTDMAAAAHAIGGDEPRSRLPTPESDDELAELGRSFNALLDRLGESLERQQRFTGDASHQLRTPLTSLQGQVDLALQAGALARRLPPRAHSRAVQNPSATANRRRPDVPFSGRR